MALSFAEVLTRFGSAKRVGQEYQAFCPVHESGGTHKTKSLSIREGDTHVALVLCRSQGCSTKAILDAVGLSWDDISAPRPTKESKQYERVHVYRDEHGVPLYRVTVERRGDGQKDVRQWRYDAATDRFVRDKQTMKGVRLVPYRLHDLHRLRPTRIFIPEGEQKCDRLWKLDLPATCNSGGGTAKWRESDTAALKAAGCAVAVLLPDNDPVGLAHIQDVATSLEAAGIHAYLTPPLPDVASGGDVVDWLKYGHTKADLLKFIEDNGKRSQTNGHNGTNGHSIVLLPAAAILDFVPDPVQWVVDGFLAIRSVVLLVAKPKVGKTTLARALSVSVAQGRSFLGAAVRQGPVWYLAFEGRFEDHRAHFVQLGMTRDDPLHVHCGPSGTSTVAEVLQAATADKPHLIIIDTMQKYLQAQDVDKYAEMSLQMAKFEHLAREANAAILVLHHMAKHGDDGTSDSVDTPLGSTAIEGGVDDTWILRRYTRYRTLAVRGRHKDLDEHLLRLTEAGSLELGADRDAADLERTAEDLHEALADATDGLPEAALLKLVTGRRLTKARALRALLADRRVRRLGAGTRGKPFVYVAADSRSGDPPGGPESRDLENIESEKQLSYKW